MYFTYIYYNYILSSYVLNIHRRRYKLKKKHIFFRSASLPELERDTFHRSPNNNIEFRQEKASQLWHYPPPPSLSPNNINRMDRYFAHRLFLWMPLTVWGVILDCPHTVRESDIACPGTMGRAGMYQKTRLVLDVDSFYVIATEYLRCSRCGRKVSVQNFKLFICWTKM